MPLLHRLSAATVRAGDSGLKAFYLAAWHFNSLLDEQPGLARPMLRILASRLREAEARTS